MIPIDLSPDALANAIALEQYRPNHELARMRIALVAILALAENAARSKPFTTLNAIHELAREGLGT